MQFFIIKPPKSNEYTYEQSLAVFSSIVAKKSKRDFLPSVPFKKPTEYFSFNIISIKQSIYFVVGATDEKAIHLKNQLYAQFPKSDISPLESFANLGEINYEALHISKLLPNNSDLLPIKTIDKFQEVDPTASVLSSMSRSADSDALYWFQMIVVPTGSSWQKKTSSKINELNASEITSESAQKKIAYMQEKLKYHGFRVHMRLITNSEQSSKMFFQAFTVFAEPSANQLKLSKPNFLKERKMTEAVQNHLPYGSSNILNTLELATLWHVPPGNINIPNIMWGRRLQLDSPENLPVATNEMTREEKADLTFIGKASHKNQEKIFGIKSKDRLRHVYIVGKTGSGKSWFIDNMAIEDIRKGNGVAVLDPHGDAIDNIIPFIPKNRINDVCYFNPSDPEYTYPINILELDNEYQRDIMVSGIIGIFYKLYSHSWGPRMEHILRNVLFTLTYADNATLPDIMKILHNKSYRNKVLEGIDDPIIKQFWTKEYDQMSDKFANEAIAPILNKVGQFATSPTMRRILERPKSKVKIEEMMDNKKIFLADLSQGKLGEDNSTLLGSMLITKIQIAAMNRAFKKEEDRVPFYLYVDEFQNFATDSFAKILSEARKYKLGLTMANQYITQIDENIMNAIFGNVGTLTCFNVGAQDSQILFKEFGSNIEPEDLTTLDQFQMIGRVMIDSVTSPAFTYNSLPLPKNRSEHRDKIIEQSRKRYGVRIKK